MRVSQILEAKGRAVTTIAEDRSVADAVALLREGGIGALVVTGDREPLVGIFSERDVVRALAEGGADALATPMRGHMSREVTICNEDTDVLQVLATMTERRFRHVPVVDGSTLSGLISIGDVVKARLDELETERRELLEYVSAR